MWFMKEANLLEVRDRLAEDYAEESISQVKAEEYKWWGEGFHARPFGQSGAQQSFELFFFNKATASEAHR